ITLISSFFPYTTLFRSLLKPIRMIYSLLDLVGNTPLVNLKRINPNPHVEVYAKLEGNNPGGSVKDRAAYSMIKGALDWGELQPGDRKSTRLNSSHVKNS